MKSLNLVTKQAKFTKRMSLHFNFPQFNIRFRIWEVLINLNIT